MEELPAAPELRVPVAVEVASVTIPQVARHSKSLIRPMVPARAARSASSQGQATSRKRIKAVKKANKAVCEEKKS